MTITTERRAATITTTVRAIVIAITTTAGVPTIVDATVVTRKTRSASCASRRRDNVRRLVKAHCAVRARGAHARSAHFGLCGWRRHHADR